MKICFIERLFSHHMAGPLPTEFVKLDEITEWYKDPAHTKLHRYFDVFAALVRSEKINGPKVLLTVTDETVDELKVVLDMTDWPDHERQHQFQPGDIIFIKRAIVPATLNLVVGAFISTFDLNPQSSASNIHRPPFAFWSPNHIIVTNEAKCRKRITQLRNFVNNNIIAPTLDKRESSDTSIATNGTASIGKGEESSSSSATSDAFEQTKEHFEQDFEPDIPFINPVLRPCKLISFGEIDTHTENYFAVKGKALKCSIDEEEESDPDQPPSAHLKNRRKVAKIIDLFCHRCNLRVPLVERLESDLSHWLEGQADHIDSFQCPTCNDVTMSFDFDVSFTISEGTSSKEGRRHKGSPSKKTNEGVRTPVTIDAVLTGLSAKTYFGQKPEDVLVSESNSIQVLNKVRAAFKADDANDSGIRRWYIVRLNCEEGIIACQFSLITIIADETDTSSSEE